MVRGGSSPWATSGTDLQPRRAHPRGKARTHTVCCRIAAQAWSRSGHAPRGCSESGNFVQLRKEGKTSEARSAPTPRLAPAAPAPGAKRPGSCLASQTVGARLPWGFGSALAACQPRQVTAFGGLLTPPNPHHASPSPPPAGRFRAPADWRIQPPGRAASGHAAAPPPPSGAGVCFSPDLISHFSRDKPLCSLWGDTLERRKRFPGASLREPRQQDLESV